MASTITKSEEAKAVTDEKSSITPSQRQAVDVERTTRVPTSAGSSHSVPVLGYRSTDSMPSPAMRFHQQQYHDMHAPRAELFSHSSARPLPVQYPVTPSSSANINTTSTTARKRPRYTHESPLVAGYHQNQFHPMPGFHSSMSSRGTPSEVPFMFGSPPNPRTQGFPFSPPYVPGSMMMGQSATSGFNRGMSMSAKLPASSTKSNERPNDDQSVSTKETPAAGQPSNENSDCWINDIPRFSSPFSSSADVHSLHHVQQRRPSQAPLGGGSSDFDPFNDELLSDSERGDGTISPFPYTRRDSI